jgi:ribosomal protein L37AE/L43A
MARNKVQFQKGLNEAQFAALYGTEDQCRDAVTQWRWPSGFVCPVCEDKQHSLVKTRTLYQCTACRRQTSLIAGTIFASTKAPLSTWFCAMYYLTQSKGVKWTRPARPLVSAC